MIALLCPTRGRPDNMRRFVKSAYETATYPVRVLPVFCIDDDDRESVKVACELDCVYVRRPRGVLAECWNACAQHPNLAASCVVLGHMGDDVVFRSPGWDVRVAETFRQFPDRIAFVYGRDGVHDERLGTHGFISWQWYKALGRVTPPYFAHDYCDTWLNEVADLIGRRVFLPDVVTEHLHPDVGKAERDQTYRDHEAAGERENVRELYLGLGGERLADAAKLRAVMQ